jgi:hypothetical chaperone protein
VVAGRPVHFSNAREESDDEFAQARLRSSLEQCGFEEIVFEYEPVAAAYSYEQLLRDDELILIGDFGGGTSDFSMLRVGPAARKERTHRILGTEGVALAGDAFDARVVRNLISLKLGRGSEYRSLDKVLPMPEWVYSDLERWHYLSFLKSNDTIQMLRSIQVHSFEPEKIANLLHIIQDDLGFYLHQSVQVMKSELSNEVIGSFVFEDHAMQMRGRVKRATFECWIEEDLQKIRGCVDRLLNATTTTPADIDRVFLTGGSSLVPAVRRIFEERFGMQKISSGSEFTSVAKGLALRALEF